MEIYCWPANQHNETGKIKQVYTAKNFFNDKNNENSKMHVFVVTIVISVYISYLPNRAVKVKILTLFFVFEALYSQMSVFCWAK